MALIKKYLSWREEKMNGPRRAAEAGARAAGESESECREGGEEGGAPPPFQVVDRHLELADAVSGSPGTSPRRSARLV